MQISSLSFLSCQWHFLYRRGFGRCVRLRGKLLKWLKPNHVCFAVFQTNYSYIFAEAITLSVSFFFWQFPVSISSSVEPQSWCYGTGISDWCRCSNRAEDIYFPTGWAVRQCPRLLASCSTFCDPCYQM